ncbi:MAG: extracellular solute-binding protein [Paenibacillaceae bacterium]|nr:extracellular solute-binding protein [Paenibacillaceae bacterium]
MGARLGKSALLLGAAALLSGLLASCTKSGETRPEASPSAAPSAAAASATPKKEEKKEISILLSHAGATYAQAVTNWDDDPYVKEMERISGYDIKPEFLGHSDFIQQLTVRFASNKLADLVRVDSISSAAAPGALEQGAFTELSGLLKQYGPNLLKNIPQTAWDAPSVSRNGKIYAIPNVWPIPNTAVLYIRQDWLEKLNMQTPKTIDDYVKFFEAVKNTDMDGNGKKDEFGFSVRENLAGSEIFFQEFGAHPSDWKFVNGQYIPAMITPEMKEAIKFWKMLYDNGYVNKNLFTAKAEEWTANVTSGKAGFWGHYVDNYTATWASKMVEKTAKIAMIAPPVGPKGDQGYGINSTGIYFPMVIPSSVKDPERVIKFLDFAWSSPEMQKFFAFGIKDRNYTGKDGKVQWDAENPKNKQNNEYLTYRLSLNVTAAGLNSPEILATLPDGPILSEAYKNAVKPVKTIAPYLPKPKAFATNPELVPGLGSGTLFLDMFAKVVLGREPLDSAFDAFVAEWKKRGGNDAIKEATEWYNSFTKK